MSQLGLLYGCPKCGHMMASHYEIGCALRATCGCPVVVEWNDDHDEDTP